MATLVFIYLYSRYINKKSNGKYSGLFMKKQHPEDERMREYTINATQKDAVNLSREVQEFLSNEKTFISLAIKEILIHILDINDKLDWIDVIIRENNEFALISIKHGGIGYPPEDYPNLDSDNINMLISISDNIDYSQILGLNNTVITIEKQ